MNTYRASLLGSCIYRMVASKLGYTPFSPPDKMLELFAQGHRWEDIVIAHLQERGFVITNVLEGHKVDEGQVFIELELSGNMMVTGHLDGIISSGGLHPYMDHGTEKRRVLEVKSMSAAEYAKFLRLGWQMGGHMERYKWQVSAYMIETDLELALCVVNRDSDPANPEYTFLYQEMPFYKLHEIRARVLMAEAYFELPDKCDAPGYPCPFYYLGACKNDGDESDEALESLMLLVMAQDKLAADETAKSKALRKQALTSMGTRKKVRTDVATISVLESSSSYLDEDAMREDGIDVDIYKRKRKGSSYVRITPKRVTDASVELDGTKES